MRSRITTEIMNTKIRYRSLTMFVFFAALVTALVSGCVSVSGGGTAAKYAYLKGSLEATLEAGLDKAYRASGDAVKDLQFAKISENKDALLGIVVARNAADKKIEIQLDKISDTLTKLTIKVGTIGDEDLSVKILEKIKANL
jgi:hypothetical protein